MRNIFIGLLFIFLDFHIDFDATRIGLIPDFIGYIIMINGLNELSFKNMRFSKIRPFAVGMAIYTGVLYAFDLLAVSFNLGGLSLLLGLASTIISLYISYNIVMGVKDMELAYSQQLNGDNLLTIWKVVAVLSLAIYLLFFIPALGILCVIGNIVVAIIFLVSFNKTKNLYYAQN